MKILLIAWLMSVSAKDFIVYAITHNVPMTSKEKVTKNYFINMGKKQGVRVGTILDVHRILMQTDVYNSNKRHHYKILLGQLKIIHIEDDAGLAELSLKVKTPPAVEISEVIIGDTISIHLEN